MRLDPSHHLSSFSRAAFTNNKMKPPCIYSLYQVGTGAPISKTSKGWWGVVPQGCVLTEPLLLRQVCPLAEAEPPWQEAASRCADDELRLNKPSIGTSLSACQSSEGKQTRSTSAP